tara:strand:+ start:115 stop:711 length:597 start_codon:yes stop_codon:yes gene_type:complete
MSAPISDFFFVEFLKSQGWPKREGGFFNKKTVVDGVIAESAFLQMKNFAMIIAKEWPEIGMKILTSQFNKGHFENGMPEETPKLFDNQSISEMEAFRPLFPEPPRSVGEISVPWEYFYTQEALTRIRTAFAFALWYGLFSPKPLDPDMLLNNDEGKKASFDIYTQFEQQIGIVYSPDDEPVIDTPVKLVEYIKDNQWE